MSRLTRVVLAAAIVAALHLSVFAAGGPPQFLTRPLLLHVAESALEHGHFVFSEDVAIPAPLAPHLGAAPFAPVSSGTNLLSTAGTNVNVSNEADSYEGETTAAATGSLLVAGSNHIYPGNCNASAASGAFGDCAPKAYASTNGSAWTASSLPRTWRNTSFGIGFDPAIDFDKNGTFYYSYGVAPLSGNYPNAIVVASSSNGTSWVPEAPVTFNTNRNFDDKYYVAIDRSNTAYANRIYVSWDRNQSNNQILYIAYSANGGASWSAPIKVNDGTTKFERVIGAYPAVDQVTGAVYDSWHDYAKNIIFVDKSTSGGATWGKDVAAVTTHAGFGTDIGCVGGRSQGPAHALKVGSTGALYLVYADPVQSRGFDVLFTKSIDGGATWATPRSLNDDTTNHDQFHPTLSVEPNGSGGDKVTVTFYDRRDDAANCFAHVYATQSTNSGSTWSANVRETTVSSDFDGNPNGPGDYSSSSPFSAQSAVFPLFSDHRASNAETFSGGAFDVYTVKVQ